MTEHGPDEPLRAAVDRFRRDNRLLHDEEGRRVWLATLGSLIVPLPNFRWRRNAIGVHDAHHLLTGYPPTLEGELSLAAWELAVGCYGSQWARLLCGALFVLGLAAVPGATLAAFRAGCRDSEGYAHLTRGFRLLDVDLSAARAALDGVVCLSRPWPTYPPAPRLTVLWPPQGQGGPSPQYRRTDRIPALAPGYASPDR